MDVERVVVNVLPAGEDVHGEAERRRLRTPVGEECDGVLLLDVLAGAEVPVQLFLSREEIYVSRGARAREREREDQARESGEPLDAIPHDESSFATGFCKSRAMPGQRAPARDPGIFRGVELTRGRQQQPSSTTRRSCGPMTSRA